MKIKYYLIIIVVGLLIILPTGKTNAQGKSGLNYGHVITADPFSILAGPFKRDVINLTYEHRLSKLNSITFSTQLHLKGEDEPWRMFGVGGSYRWYFKLFEDGKQPIEGFSFGPSAFLVFSYFDPGYKYDTKNSPSMEVDLAIGGEASYKFIFSDFVVEPIIRFLIGIPEPVEFRVISLGLNLGYAW